MSKTNFCEWTLMHKDVPVATVLLLERNATIIQVTTVHNLNHAPIGTTIDDKIDPEKLEYWLNKRVIPASRKNIDKVLEALKIQNTRSLALKSYGLSLSDQYWIKPQEKKISWTEVNFFENEFSDDLGQLLFGNEKSLLPEINFFSPDSSADGWLEKKWVIDASKRLLLKGSTSLYRQEPYNEKIASDIMQRLGINHSSYELVNFGSKAYSLCECFIDANTELIPAIDIVLNTPQEPGDTKLTHLLRGCEILGMDVVAVKQELDKMLVVDYLIANYDRHWRNFGFIRNANTLEWQGFAPIFDSGAALWQNHDQITSEVKSEAFEATGVAQLKLITDLAWYKPMDQDEVRKLILATLNQHPTMPAARIQLIATTVVKHTKVIQALQKQLSCADSV